MKYCMSDIHGRLSVDKLEEFLRSSGFDKSTDTLFVLGDVIDRGEYGIPLLRWCMDSEFVRYIYGNHEAWMMASLPVVFGEISDETTPEDAAALENYRNWTMYGTEATIRDIRRLREESYDEFCRLVRFLEDSPRYAETEAGGHRFVLSHSGLGNFRPDKPLSEYTERELIWAKPKLDTRYFEDATVVLGHSPTEDYDRELRGKILKTDTWIDIDTTNPLSMLCLDTGEEFYIPVEL